MKILGELRLHKIVSHRETKLSLNKYPLVIIRGQNLDRKNKTNSNAAGKSLMLAALRNVLYHSLETSVRKMTPKN